SRRGPSRAWRRSSRTGRRAGRSDAPLQAGRPRWRYPRRREFEGGRAPRGRRLHHDCDAGDRRRVTIAITSIARTSVTASPNTAETGLKKTNARATPAHATREAIGTLVEAGTAVKAQMHQRIPTRWAHQTVQYSHGAGVLVPTAMAAPTMTTNTAT